MNCEFELHAERTLSHFWQLEKKKKQKKTLWLIASPTKDCNKNTTLVNGTRIALTHVSN